MRRLLIAVCVMLSATVVYAAPPPGTDLNSPSHKWWECQHQFGSTANCCGESDGHVIAYGDWRLQQDKAKVSDFPYEVRIRGKWFDVPASKVTSSGDCGPDPSDETRSLAKAWYSEYDVDGSIADVNFFCFETGIEG